MNVADVAFDCMGTEMRVICEGPRAERAAEDARAWLRDADARLSRFRPGSELCALNGDPRDVVPASPLLCAAVAAGRWAAERTGGLVDPTLVGALCRAGYARSRAGVAPAPLAAALASAPPRRPAAPHPGVAWRAIVADRAAGTVRRPVGVAIDSGGTGKGLAADAVARRLAGVPRFAVDCGGDVHVGGAEAAGRSFEVEVEHPLTGEVAHILRVRGGGVATSGIGSRIWRRPDGGFAHHLLDPATGEPAWTGLLGVTALAPSTLKAETFAKAALLSGAEGARRVLAVGGGVIVHDDGDVELVGPVRAAAMPRFTVRLGGGAAA
jgi:thiamine biosynthesis lipoprotein